jgi:glycerol kinase
VRYILALDEGTTSARAALYDENAQRVAMESEPVSCVYPQPGWVEQDPEEIWRAQLQTAQKAIAAKGIRASDIAAIGIANQRETAIVWDRATGRAVSPAIVWQCRRTGDYCNELRASTAAGEITRRTGLVIDAYFSASKLRWILERHRRDGLLFGTVDTWLIWRLTNGECHVTDTTNASRTMLMNLRTGDWDDDLLRMFEVPRSMLPRIVPSSGMIGIAAAEHLGAGIPITGIAGDQQAALAGQACFRPGLAKNTYGTGCFALMHTGAEAPVSRNQLLATRAASFDSQAQFAVEGSIFIAGSAVQWLRDRMGLLRTAAESAAMAHSVSDTGGVYLVPAFVGLGAPYWDPGARGAISGLTLGTTNAHIVRAALESIAYQTRDLIEAMQADSGQKLAELRVDGGAAANDFLMQFQADVLGCRILRPVDTETTALGAAYLAGVAAGVWKNTSELESFWRVERTFEPQMSAGARDELYAGWKNAVTKTLSAAPA